jgi:hypothetical protein
MTELPDGYRPQRAWFEDWGLSLDELAPQRAHTRSVIWAGMEGQRWGSGDRIVEALRRARYREADAAYLEEAASGRIKLLGQLQLPGQPIAEPAALGLPPAELRRCTVGRATDRLTYRYREIIWRWAGMMWCNTIEAMPVTAARPLTLEQAVDEALAQGFHPSQRAPSRKTWGELEKWVCAQMQIAVDTPGTKIRTIKNMFAFKLGKRSHP